MTQGRPSGVPSKNRKFLMNRLQDMYGKDFHPIMNMAAMAVDLHAIAQKTSDVSDMKACIDAWDKVAQYTEPKLKAVEVTGEGGGALSVNLMNYSVD